MPDGGVIGGGPDRPRPAIGPVGASPPGRPVIRSAWLRLVVYLVVFTAVQIVGSSLALALLRLIDPGLLETAIGQSDLLRRAPLIMVPGCVLGIAATLLLWWRVDNRPVAAIGLPAGPGAAREFLRGSGAAVALMMAASLPVLLVNAAGIRFLPEGLRSFLGGFLLYGLVLLLVALNEELAFRGYLLGNLLPRVGAPAAVVVSAVLFAAFHLQNPHLSPLAYLNLHLAGAFFALAVLRRGSLWFAIGCHFAWNHFLSVVLALPVSGLSLPGLVAVRPGGPAWLTGGEFGPEGSLAATVVLTLACLWMARGPKRGGEAAPGGAVVEAGAPGGGAVVGDAVVDAGPPGQGPVSRGTSSGIPG